MGGRRAFCGPVGGRGAAPPETREDGACAGVRSVLARHGGLGGVVLAQRPRPRWPPSVLSRHDGLGGVMLAQRPRGTGRVSVLSAFCRGRLQRNENERSLTSEAHEDGRVPWS